MIGQKLRLLGRHRLEAVSLWRGCCPGALPRNRHFRRGGLRCATLGAPFPSRAAKLPGHVFVCDVSRKSPSLSFPSLHYIHQCPSITLGPLAPDPARELDILWHDGDTLRVDRTEVSVLEEANQVGLGGLLEGKDG